MDKSYEAPKGRLLTTVIIFVFIVAILYTLFLWFQNSSANRELTRLDSEISKIQLDIENLKSQQIQELVVAEEIIATVEARSITWSKVIRKLEDLTPVGVFFRTYSGGETGDIEITAIGDGYGNVADVIRILVDSDDFDEVFVPTVALGTSSDGQQIVSFGIQLKTVSK